MVLIVKTTISSIGSFGTSQASMNWPIPSASTQRIFVRIDPFNTVDELDETKNDKDGAAGNRMRFANKRKVKSFERLPYGFDR